MEINTALTLLSFFFMVRLECPRMKNKGLRVERNRTPLSSSLLQSLHLSRTNVVCCRCRRCSPRAPSPRRSRLASRETGSGLASQPQPPASLKRSPSTMSPRRNDSVSFGSLFLICSEMLMKKDPSCLQKSISWRPKNRVCQGVLLCFLSLSSNCVVDFFWL